MRNEFWVSPSGIDTNPGTKEHPFRTLEKARDNLRSQNRQEEQDHDIYIWLKAGTYRLEKPFILSEKDGGRNNFKVIYKAEKDAVSTLSGSIKINNWEVCPFSPSIYRASVPHGTKSRQLYVNGKRMTRARTPSYPKGFVPIYAKGGICYECSFANNRQWNNPAQWNNIDKVEAVIQTQWKMMRVPLQAVDPRAGIISLQNPAWENANLYRVSKKNPDPGIWSFWQVTWFENALEFLTDCGEWYLDEKKAWLYYKPFPDEDLLTGDVNVELPVLEKLVIVEGSMEKPAENIEFEGLTFSYATWLTPGTNEGYVADQSGFRVIGEGHRPNITGHVKHVVKTPGNISIQYVRSCSFCNNSFTHLGCVGLDFGEGSRNNNISGNYFSDISSAAIQLGDVCTYDNILSENQIVSMNTIADNEIESVAVEFVDAAGIFVGFSEYSTISGNKIKNVPWSGIAMGWGWGLLDPDGYPGLNNANWFEWGKNNYHTKNRYNKIVGNRIEKFLLTCWDGGAIYTTGYQGTNADDSLLIQGNTAADKNPELGGNVFYTDGGSRWIILLQNRSVNNPVGHPYFGPAPLDPFVYLKFRETSELLSGYFTSIIQNIIPYGGDIGGCRTYGDIKFIGNTGIKTKFYDICPFSYDGTSYPTNMMYDNNNNYTAGNNGSGASYPPVNPSDSWHIPRISLPGIMGMQSDYLIEWWYYAGVVYSKSGRSFSLMFTIQRAGHHNEQVGISMLGLGWQDAECSQSVHGFCLGIGASHNPDLSHLLNSLYIKPVTDSDFEVAFRPLIQFINTQGNLLHPPFILNKSNNWNIKYTGGEILGTVNSTYQISARGKGYLTTSNTPQISESDFQITLSFADQKGMVMENKGGVVGTSYECAQPMLNIIPGGTIRIDGDDFTIDKGQLWMDRQMLAGAIGGSNIPLSEEKHLLRWFESNRQMLGKSLYTGNWMSVTLNNGFSLVLVEFWKQHPEQWVSGTQIGRPENNPLSEGFGNIYYSNDYARQYGNGGRFLRPRLTLEQTAEEWDYDVNLLAPGNNAKNSPRWKSPQSGITYATAWHIEFSPLLHIKELPGELFLFALCENSEIILSKENAFFEGAAFACQAPDPKSKIIGQAFVEQMGYN